MSDTFAEIEARYGVHWTERHADIYDFERDVDWLIAEVRRLRDTREKLRKNIARLLEFIAIECPGSEQRLAEWVNSKQEDGA